MRSLHIFDHSLPLHSGYSFRSLALLKEHRKRGRETIHITTPKHYKEGPNPEQVLDGFEFYRSPALNPLIKGKALLDPLGHIITTMKAAVALAERVKPDVIHAHSPALTAYAAHRAAKKLDIPWIYEVRAFWEDAAASHGGPGEGSVRYTLSRRLESWAMHNADGVTAICQGLLKDIKARGVDEKKLAHIPNAVDAAQFQPPVYDQALAEDLNLVDKLVLGFLGSFYDYEGLDILIDALPEILKVYQNARLLLVGGGPCEEKLKAQVERLGLQEYVHFTGRVPQTDVGRYYGLVDMLVFPRKSIRLTELVTPLKPLEAMAQKKLVIASDIGGHRELIDHQKTGFLFRPDDPKAIADCVCDLVQDKDVWPKILEAGRAFVEEERNWSRSVDNYDALYKHLGVSVT